MRYRKRHQACAQDTGQHVQARPRRNCDCYERGLGGGRSGCLPGQKQEGRVGKAQVTGHRKRKSGFCGEPKTCQREYRQRDAEQLKTIDRNEFTQEAVATLKYPKHSEVHEPEKLRTGRVIQRTRRQLSTEGGDKERQRAKKLQLEKSVHQEKAIRRRRLACLNGAHRLGSNSGNQGPLEAEGNIYQITVGYG